MTGKHENVVMHGRPGLLSKGWEQDSIERSARLARQQQLNAGAAASKAVTSKTGGQKSALGLKGLKKT